MIAIKFFCSVLIVLPMLFGLAACGSNPKAAEPVVADPSGAVEYDRSGELPVLVGTAIEASTGKVLVGVEIKGPEGQSAITDAEGRFVLRGLKGGEGCLVTATSKTGLQGENRLRSLAGGRLEVVIYLR